MAPEVVALVFTAALAVASAAVAVWSSVQLRRLRDALERETRRQLDEAYAALRSPISVGLYGPARAWQFLTGIQPHAEQELGEAVRELATAVAAYQGASMVGLTGAVEAVIRAHGDQAWYWTPEWHVKEREVDEAIAGGQLTTRTAEEFDAWLDRIDAEAEAEAKAAA